MTRLQKIVDKIVARLNEITQANGYRTDAGLHTVLIDCEVDPERIKKEHGTGHESGLVIQDQPAEPTDVKLGHPVFAHITREMAIYGFRKMTDRANWFPDAQALEADIKQAIFSKPEDQQYFRQIGLKAIRLGTAQAKVPGYADEFVGVEVALELTYVENLSEPWEPDE